MESLLASLPASTVAGLQNTRALTLRSTNYGEGPEHEEISFEGILTGQGIQGSMSHYWNGPGSMGSSSPAKRLHTDHSNATEMDENSSFVSLLNQLPQTSTFHHNSVLGSLPDAAYKQPYSLPSMNWNS